MGETLRESKEQKMSEHALDSISNLRSHGMLNNEKPPKTLREAINQRVGRPGADLAPMCHRFAELSWLQAYMESLDVRALSCAAIDHRSASTLLPAPHRRSFFHCPQWHSSTRMRSSAPSSC